MVANVGPADYNYDETISTLRYATRAKSIKNHATVNEDPKDALLRKFQKEIEELKKQLGEGYDYEGEDAGTGSDDEYEVDENGKKIQKVKSMRFFIVWEKWITFYGTQFFQLSSMILWNTSSTP